MLDSKYYPWILLAYVFVMQAVIIGIAVYSFPFFVMTWLEEFAVERALLMMAVSGSSIGTALLSPLGGYLLDRYSSRSLILFGASSFALGLLFVSRASHAGELIALYILVLPFGMVLSGSLVASSLVARNFSNYQGLAFGISALGVSAGGFIAPVLVTRLLEYQSWNILFVYFSAFVALLVIVPGLMIVRDPMRRADVSTSTSTSASAGRINKLSVIYLGVSFFSPVLIFVAVLHNLGALAADYSIPQHLAAWLVSVASIVMAISKLASGILCDRLNHKIIYLGLLLSQCFGLIILIQFHDFSWILLGVALIALGAGGSLPVVTSYAAATYAPGHIGRVMGVIFAMAGMAGIGPVIAGVIRDASGDYGLAFVALLIAIVPAGWCFLSLNNRLQRDAHVE